MIRKWTLPSNLNAGSVPGRPSSEGTVRALFRWPAEHWEGLWVGTILLIAALAHGINMFDYPLYLEDEGIYVSQAWAVAEMGTLAPYTYWYDHAPLGWIQIAVWSMATGGFDTFGTAIDSGRVLMLVMQVISTLVLYLMARSISGSAAVATIVSLTFALCAYGIYYHRRVLLDNVATFWLLLSIMPLVCGRLTLNRVWFSAVAISVSALSKELTVFVVPILAYLVFCRADETHRRFATIGWLAIVGCIGSLYFLMATLKGELLPAGTVEEFEAGTTDRVSLLGTLQWQASRGGGEDSFWTFTEAWSGVEPLLVVVGSIAAAISVLLIKRHRLIGIMGLVTFSLWLFMARGGIVLEFYLLPLLPLLALNLGLVLGLLADTVKLVLGQRARIAGLAHMGVLLVAAGLCLLLTARGYVSGDLNTLLRDQLGSRDDVYKMWNNQQALAQRQAIDWIQANLSPQSSIVIDRDMYTDLHDVPVGTASFEKAHHFRTVALDPEIRDDVFSNNWRNIDYIVCHPGMVSQINKLSLEPAKTALHHSTLVKTFDTGGYPIEIRRVDKS